MRSYTEEFAPPSISSAPMSAGAGFGIRFLARGLDILYLQLLALFTGVFSGIVFAILGSMGVLAENWMEGFKNESMAGVFWGVLGMFLYHMLTEGIGGTTIGKLICGLNVAQEDGRPCTALGALKRGIVYHFDALFLGLVAYNSMKDSALRQRYGDVWGKTVVVKKSVFRPDPARPIWRILVGLALGSLTSMGVMFWHLWLQVT